MKEGFFLDRIQVNCARISINQAVIFPIPVFPYSADASLSLSDATAVRAQFTLNFSSLERSEIGR
jgi:hypothetical protein